MRAMLPLPLRANPRVKLCGKIESFARLPGDRTETDAIPPDRATVRFACDLVQKLPAETPLPHASRSTEGEIGLSWSKGNDRFEVLLQPDGHLVWAKERDGKIVPGEDIDLRTEHTFGRLYDDVVRFYA
jgi:hypothetical protein